MPKQKMVVLCVVVVVDEVTLQSQYPNALELPNLPQLDLIGSSAYDSSAVDPPEDPLEPEMFWRWVHSLRRGRHYRRERVGLVHKWRTHGRGSASAALSIHGSRRYAGQQERRTKS